MQKNRLFTPKHLTERSVRVAFLAFVVLAVGVRALGELGAQEQTQGAQSGSVGAILDRYVNALGGKAVLEKQSTRASMGTVEMAGGHLRGTVLMHEKAPAKTLQVVIVAGTAYRQGFDGQVGWTDDPQNGPQEMSGQTLNDVARDADFFHALHLRQLYTKLTLTGKEKIGNEDVSVVEGGVPGSDVPDKMYFSAKTGLLLRVVGMRHIPDGLTALQDDFLDYRKVEGVEVPFTIVQTGGADDLTIKIDQVRFGVDLNDDEFSMPEFP